MSPLPFCVSPLSSLLPPLPKGAPQLRCGPAPGPRERIDERRQLRDIPGRQPFYQTVFSGSPEPRSCDLRPKSRLTSITLRSRRKTHSGYQTRKAALPPREAALRGDPSDRYSRLKIPSVRPRKAGRREAANIGSTERRRPGSAAAGREPQSSGGRLFPAGRYFCRSSRKQWRQIGS